MHLFHFRVAEFPFLLLTTNSLQNRYLTVSFLMSHALTTSRVMGPFFGRKPTLMKRDPNKLGTRNTYGINASNCYFSSRKDNPGSRVIPFLPLVDPKGALTGLSSSMTNFVHTQENQVQYFEYVADSTGIKGY
jgi:hypothetical protein